MRSMAEDDLCPTNTIPQLLYRHAWRLLFSALEIEIEVTGSYEMFTMPQNPTNRLRREQWYQLRDIIRWIQPTQAAFHTSGFPVFRAPLTGFDLAMGQVDV